jgi:glycosyltransferase involved in cell wall biosynthesis
VLLRISIGTVFEEYGGVSRHIFNIKKYSTHKIKIVPSKFVRVFLNRFRSTKQYYMRFMNEARINRHDVIHSHADPWFEKLCLASRSDRCKWIHTFHSLFFDADYKGGLQKWQEEANKSLIEVASKADIRISVCKWLHDYLSEKHSIETVIVENGVDIEECDKACAKRFTNKYHLNNFVLYVGGIREVKDPLLFVRLAKRLHDLTFVMIGERLTTINLQNAYGIRIPKNIVMLGELSHMDILDAMAKCIAYVVTSKRETGPLTLLEAMAIRKPVVAPKHSGCKEIVSNSDYGILYEPNSLDDLVEKTKAALDSGSVGDRARERIEQKYDWKMLAPKIDSLYESCE